jgi:hypothetical protein
MADITMTQIPGTTHHYRALIDVDPGNLTPTVDLENYLTVAGQPRKIVDAIEQDPFIEETIEAEFEAQTTSVKYCQFLPGSYSEVVAPNGTVISRTIKLDITTISPIVEQGAIEMKFEFLHTGPR